MLYSFFYENDHPERYSDWLDIELFCGFDGTSADEVWEIARCSDTPPHLGNISMSITLSNIQSWCEERNIDCDIFINSIDSHLTVNGKEIYTLDDFLSAIGDTEQAAA